MKFPEDLASLINENTSDKLLEILMLNGDTEEIDKNLRSWTVTYASSTRIDISLTFEKPITVSTGYSPDILFIQVFFSAYTDHNG